MKNKKSLLLIPLILGVFYYQSSSSLRDSKSTEEKETIHRTPASTHNLKTTATSTIDHKPASIKSSFTERNLKASLEVYKKMKRYPSTTQPFAKGAKVDPIAQRISARTHRQLGESAEFYEIETKLEKNLINQLDKKIAFELKTYKKGQKHQAKKVYLTGESMSRELTSLSEGIYALDFPVSEWQPGEHKLDLIVEFENEKIQNEILIQKDTLIAHHKNSYLPQISSEGDLILKNDFEFLVHGDVLVEAVLYSEAGELIGKAHQVIAVQPGLKSFELNFYGLLFHDAQINGSLNLKHIQFTLVDENLTNKAIQVSEINQRSPSFHWEQFRSTPYDNQLLEEKIARLENLAP